MAARSPAQIVELLDQAFNEGDVSAVLSFYENEAVVVTEPGKTARGTEELRSFFKEVMQSGSSAKQIEVRVLEADGVALFLSRWTLHAKGAEPDIASRTFTATTVFRKQSNGEWKVLIDNPFGPLILGSD